jgi:hypothetical protein
MTLEERIAIIENERQINHLLVRYCELVDSGRPDLIATEFYHEDIVADYHCTMLRGRAMIHEFYVSGMADFAETAHSVSNVIIRACDGQTAEMTSMLIAFHWHDQSDSPGTGRPADFGLVVQSEDRLKRTAEGWRVSERRARALGPTFALEKTALKLQRKG